MNFVFNFSTGFAIIDLKQTSWVEKVVLQLTLPDGFSKLIYNLGVVSGTLKGKVNIPGDTLGEFKCSPPSYGRQA